LGMDAFPEIRTTLQVLQILLNERTAARNRGDQAQVALIEERMTLAMRRVGDVYPEGGQQFWYDQAEKFSIANPKEKKDILLHISYSVDALLPLWDRQTLPPLEEMIALGGIAAVCTVLDGVGKVFQGVGSLFEGMFR
ncbi:hypothetical protein FRC11_002812, partial [Ceratobasidium sp. 423]